LAITFFYQLNQQIELVATHPPGVAEGAATTNGEKSAPFDSL
jgi:hypothetical protein